MEAPDYLVFSKLYMEAYQRCFNKPLTLPATEAESKIFYQQILDTTGLTVGWRSLKNYSLFVLDNSRDQNPSVASMDTLARYVLKAPYTNDIDRKQNEEHHPYWFMYRRKMLAQPKRNKTSVNQKWMLIPLILLLFLISVSIFLYSKSFINVADNFDDLSENHFSKNGWTILNKNDAYWHRRKQSTGNLTLFTLAGDNWPDNGSKPTIENLLVHALPKNCFTAELQMQYFTPAAEWQQAGLLLLADTSLNSASVRVSLAYNDMFGGYDKPHEVLVQGITSTGHNSKPEEFAHWPVLTLDSTVTKALVLLNLNYSALRIERSGKQYRFLYAGGTTSNGAFKEVAVKNISFEPHYIAIFALKGRVLSTAIKPVIIKNFFLQATVCE